MKGNNMMPHYWSRFAKQMPVKDDSLIKPTWLAVFFAAYVALMAGIVIGLDIYEKIGR